MKQGLKPLLLLFVACLFAWGGASWYFAQSAKQAFQEYLTQLSAQDSSHFFELEMDDYRETIFGANASLSVNFSVPALIETLGELKLNAKRFNGPVFIADGGVQFGIARWVLTIDQTDEELPSNIQVLFDGTPPKAVIRFDFSDKAHINVTAKKLRLNHLSIDDLALDGWFETNTDAYDLTINTKQSDLKLDNWLFTMPDSQLSLQHFPKKPSKSPQKNSQQPSKKTSIDSSVQNEQTNAVNAEFRAERAQLVLRSNQKKFPLTLSSHGSVWLINDTLSGDWEMLALADLLKATQQLQVKLQFREWLAEGFLTYWQQQAEIASLLEQVDWVLEEEVETPEQQDFLRLLLGEAHRIQTQQSSDFLRPMLAFEQSQLLLDAQLTGADGLISHLALAGKTEGAPVSPVLNLSGESTIQRSLFDESNLPLMNLWSRRTWLRPYESVFETDIVVRNRQLLLNDIRVSLVSLLSELKQLANDQ